MQVKSKSFQIILSKTLSVNVPALSVTSISVPANYLFLDAREEREYRVSHIEGARFAGYACFNIRTLDDVGKSTPIIVYCSIGKRSEAVTQMLLNAGFNNVRNLYGGIFEWVNESRPIVDENENITNQVHAYNRLFGQWLQRGKKIYE